MVRCSISGASVLPARSLVKFLKCRAAEISRTKRSPPLKTLEIIERFLHPQEELSFEYGWTSLLPVFERKPHGDLQQL